MSLTLTVEFPALDRLCAWLEGHDKAGLVGEIEKEIVRKLEEAVKGGVPRPEFKEVPVTEEHPWKDEAKETEGTGNRDIERPENAPVERFQRDGAGRPLGTGKAPSPKVDRPTEGEAEETKTATAQKPVTLADVQRVAAQMRDEGKLSQVTGIFKEFGINKLSDLQGDALQKFAAKLRGMGAKI